MSAWRVDAGKVKAVGTGESSPVNKDGNCKGDANTPALISCLQPNRQVEIEVTGTR